MSSLAAGLLPCDSRQTSRNGISSITSGVQVEALTVSPVPSSHERVRTTWTKEIKILSRNLQHNQFRLKSTTMTTEWHTQTHARYYDIKPVRKRNTGRPL